jgi:hypothetical protein
MMRLACDLEAKQWKLRWYVHEETGDHEISQEGNNAQRKDPCMEAFDVWGGAVLQLNRATDHRVRHMHTSQSDSTALQFRHRSTKCMRRQR